MLQPQGTFAPQWWLLNPEDWLSHYFQLCKGVPCSLAVLGLRMSTQAFWTVPKRMSLRVTLVRQINWFHTALAHGRWAASEYSTQLQTFSLSASLSHVESEGNEGGSVAKWWHDITRLYSDVRSMYEVHHPSARAMQLHYEFAEDYGICSRSGPRKCQAFHSVMIFRRHSRCLPGVFAKKFLRTTWPGCAAGCCEQTPWASQTCCLRWICIMFIFFPTNIDKCDVFAYFCYSSVSFLPCKNLRWVPFLPGCSLFQGGPFSTGASFWPDVSWRIPPWRVRSGQVVRKTKERTPNTALGRMIRMEDTNSQGTNRVKFK